MHHTKIIVGGLVAAMACLFAPSVAAQNQSQAQYEQYDQCGQCNQVLQKGETHIQCPAPMPRRVVEQDLGGREYTLKHHTHTVDTKVVTTNIKRHQEDWREGQDTKTEYPAEKVVHNEFEENWQTNMDKCEKDGSETSVMSTNKAMADLKLGERTLVKEDHTHNCIDTTVTEHNSTRTEEWEEVEERDIAPQTCVQKAEKKGY